MRKPKPLEVIDYEDLVAKREYLVRVTGVRSNLKTGTLTVHVVHLSREQDGRSQEFSLPLPVLPGGRTAAFFRACGIAVAIGTPLSAADAVRRQLKMRFGSVNDDETLSFSQPKEMNRNASAAQ